MIRLTSSIDRSIINSPWFAYLLESIRPRVLLVDGAVDDRAGGKMLSDEFLLVEIGDRDALSGHFELYEQELSRVLVGESFRVVQRMCDAL